MGRHWSNALFFLLAVFLLSLAIGPIEKRTVVTCEFEPQAGASQFRLPSNSNALGKIRVDGSLSGNGKDGLYHYEGRGMWMIGGKQVAGAVSGPIFLASDGSVKALFFSVAHPAFGQEDLTIATLNRDGILDWDRSTAFLFVDPREKLLHPARYNCRSDRNYDHVYQRLASFNWPMLIAFLAVVWAVMFFARRKADKMEFGDL